MGVPTTLTATASPSGALGTSDVEIGAVEIKDGVTDQRAVVGTDGAVYTKSPPITVSPAIVSVSTSGSVAAGKRYVAFSFSSDFAGTILGAAFTGPGDVSFTFPALPPNNSYGAIAYTITAGIARIASF
jgi:hypothetical protein